MNHDWSIDFHTYMKPKLCEIQMAHKGIDLDLLYKSLLLEDVTRGNIACELSMSRISHRYYNTRRT